MQMAKWRNYVACMREGPPIVACGTGSGEFVLTEIRNNHFIIAFILKRQLFSQYECSNNLTASYLPIKKA